MGPSPTGSRDVNLSAIRVRPTRGGREHQWHSFKHRLIRGKKVVIQSAVGGSAGLRFLHFLLGRRERRG